MKAERDSKKTFQTADGLLAVCGYCAIFDSPQIKAMRYALSISNNIYLAACYEATGSGIMMTDKPEDACSYVTLDKALAVAAAIAPNLGKAPCVVEVNY